MTKDNQRKNVAAEVSRAEESRRAAAVLLAAGLGADAVSRAYYGAFHYARAVLLSESEEPRTQGGVDRLLQRDFVRAGRFDADIAKLFTRLQRYRQDADYTSEYVFTPSAAAEEIAAAETFIGEARRFLVAAGLWTRREGGLQDTAQTPTMRSVRDIPAVGLFDSGSAWTRSEELRLLESLWESGKPPWKSW